MNFLLVFVPSFSLFLFCPLFFAHFLCFLFVDFFGGGG